MLLFLNKLGGGSAVIFRHRKLLDLLECFHFFFSVMITMFCAFPIPTVKTIHLKIDFVKKTALYDLGFHTFTGSRGPFILSLADLSHTPSLTEQRGIPLCHHGGRRESQNTVCILWGEALSFLEPICIL